MCSSCVFFYMVCARILSQCCETFQHHGSFGNSYPLAIQHGHGDGPFGPFADDFAVKNGGFPRGYHHRIPPEGTILIHTSPINPFPPWFSRGFIDIGIQLGRVQYQGDGIYHEFPDYLRCF